jgi:hypothetical protein
MKFVRYFVLAGFTVSAAATLSFAAIELDPGSELFATVNTGLQYNDNVLLSQDGKKSDEIFDIAPGLLATWGQAAEFNGQASFSEDFSEYFSNSSLDSNLAKADLLANYNDSVTIFNAIAFFHQVDQATRDVRGADSLIHRNLSHVELGVENQIASKTTLKLGFAYDDTAYQNPAYVDWRWYEFYLNGYYKVEPKLDLSAGVRYKENQLGAGGFDSNEYYYYVGARGELAPKLTGEFTVGYNESQLNGHGTKNGLGLESTFTYAYTPKTTFMFAANDDFGYSGDGTAYKTFGFSGGIESAISDVWKVDGLLMYGDYSYTTVVRTDDFYQAQISATYNITKEMSLAFAYAYAKNSSTVSGDSFSNNILSVTGSFRF